MHGLSLGGLWPLPCSLLCGGAQGCWWMCRSGSMGWPWGCTLRASQRQRSPGFFSPRKKCWLFFYLGHRDGDLGWWCGWGNPSSVLVPHCCGWLPLSCPHFVLAYLVLGDGLLPVLDWGLEHGLMVGLPLRQVCCSPANCCPPGILEWGGWRRNPAHLWRSAASPVGAKYHGSISLL